MQKGQLVTQTKRGESYSEEGYAKSGSKRDEEFQQEMRYDEKKLRRPRTRLYLNALRQADEKGCLNISVVRKLPLNHKLVGILAACKLNGRMIHAIDREGNVVEHYNSIESIPVELRGGYYVYRQHPDCFAVEVYVQYYCVIYDRGNVDFIERNSSAMAGSV